MADVGATDPAAFRDNMQQVLQTVLNHGVIPVVTTIQPRPGSEAQVQALNEALIEAVQNVESSTGTAIPIYNLWRAYSELPGSGLTGDNMTPSVAPAGAGDLSAAGSFGMNTRNQQILTLLDQLRSVAFPSAAP